MALKYLRDNLKSLTWVLWGVVAVFILLVFFEWGGVNERRGGRADVAATVGDEKITMGEFRDTYRNLEAYYRRTFGEQFNNELAKQLNLPTQALDQLINRRILLMEARDIGLRATDAEVREAILESPSFQDENGRFVGTERYREILQLNRMNTEEFESSVRDDVLFTKLNAILAQTAYVSDAEVEESYREEAERATIRFVQLPATELSDVTATAAEIEAYFADHQADYELPEQRVAEYLLVDTLQLRRELEIPEEELRAYYEENPDDFTREEQVRARHILMRVTPDRPEEQVERELEDIRRRIEAGEDFAAMAREYSDDESNAERGGNLGYFGRGRMIKAFEDAAFDAAIGDLVGPVKTDFGYHLIDVQDHREGGLQPFEQVRAVVQARLGGQRSEEIGEAKIRDIDQRIASEQLSSEEGLQALAEEEGLTMQTTEPFGLNDSITGIGRAPEFNRVAFELSPGERSDPIKLPRGWAILWLKEVSPPRLPELADVEADVRRDAEQQKRKAAARERLEELRRQVEESGDFEALVADLGLEIQESEEFGRFDSITGLGANREVIDRALELSAGQWGGPAESDLGAVLFEVTDRKTFDPAQFEQEKAAIRSREEQERVNQLVASIIELRRRDLTPKYDNQVLANFGIDQPGVG